MLTMCTLSTIEFFFQYSLSLPIRQFCNSLFCLFLGQDMVESVSWYQTVLAPPARPSKQSQAASAPPASWSPRSEGFGSHWQSLTVIDSHWQSLAVSDTHGQSLKESEMLKIIERINGLSENSKSGVGIVYNSTPYCKELLSELASESETPEVMDSTVKVWKSNKVQAAVCINSGTLWAKSDTALMCSHISNPPENSQVSIDWLAGLRGKYESEFCMRGGCRPCPVSLQRAHERHYLATLTSPGIWALFSGVLRMCNYFYIGTQICVDLISAAVLFETFIGDGLGPCRAVAGVTNPRLSGKDSLGQVGR